LRAQRSNPEHKKHYNWIASSRGSAGDAALTRNDESQNKADRSAGILAKQVDIESKRLLLRRWQESDIEAFISMNADTTVMRYFPAPLSAEETTTFYDSIQQEFSEYGYGLYAVEEKDSGCFLGYIGFHWSRFDMDFCPCVEIGWRLEERYWGKGYATEGAIACLKHGFEKLGFDEVVGFTAVENIASQRVMQKIGMQFERCFEHPGIAEGHPLRPHVFYRINKSNYQV